MADNRTMAELLQAPTEGYEDAIVIPEITANNFELKRGLINLVQNKQFFGHDKEEPPAHIRYFNKITSTMRVPNVPSSSIKLMLFPFSLEGAARIWLEKEPPRSIQTWDYLVSKFINQFFPPSKTTNLRNEITRFQQRFDESFYEAWERLNDLLRACPHHRFSELHQLDTFYNALNVNNQDSLNSAAGGNFLDKMPRECLKIIESKSKLCQSRAKTVVAKVGTSSSTPVISFDVAEFKDMVKALLLDKKNQSPAPTPSTTPAPVKAVEPNCAPIPQTQRVSQTDFESYVKANDAISRNMQSQGQSTQNECQNIQNQYQNLQNQMATLMEMMSKLVSANTASSSGSGTLPVRCNFSGSKTKKWMTPTLLWQSIFSLKKKNHVGVVKSLTGKLLHMERSDIVYNYALTSEPEVSSEPTGKYKWEFGDLAQLAPEVTYSFCKFGPCEIIMEDPNITMEEYIRLEEEKAHRCGKVYNWETATYGKIWYDEDLHNLRSVETEFPAIVLNDALTYEVTLSSEPTVRPLNDNQIDIRISFDESDDEDYTPSVSCIDDLDIFKDFENEFPAIVYNDALTFKSDFSTEPTLCPQHIDEFNLKDEKSLSECDEKEHNILYFNDLFLFNVIYPNDLKSDKDNDDDKIDIKQSLGDMSVIPLPNVINTVKQKKLT
uniref:Reverse transcriptase domain-containing protein n=1 Tax=Tanacetum cinerariifolium TaxID=118510 RepID=A0A6L2N2V1_TANCI|nr:reverse transcriptase domain-containing protein [Tanacetum cinerariifolium]